MKRFLRIFMMMGCFSILTGSALLAQVKGIEPQQLQSFMSKNPGAQLVDVREGWERQRAKIPKSRHISLSEISTAKDKLDLEKPVITYCKSGRRSQNAAEVLEKMGFKEVYTLKGGIEAYSIEVDPSIPRY